MGFAHKQDQHDHRDHIGDHGNELHIDAGGAAQHHLEAGAEAEEQTADERALGLELAEDHRRDGDEALAYDGDGAELGGDGHGDARAAQARPGPPGSRTW